MTFTPTCSNNIKRSNQINIHTIFNTYLLKMGRILSQASFLSNLSFKVLHLSGWRCEVCLNCVSTNWFSCQGQYQYDQFFCAWWKISSLVQKKKKSFVWNQKSILLHGWCSSEVCLNSVCLLCGLFDAAFNSSVDIKFSSEQLGPNEFLEQSQKEPAMS